MKDVVIIGTKYCKFITETGTGITMIWIILNSFAQIVTLRNIIYLAKIV